MDDERQAGHLGRLDMGAQAYGLCLARGIVIEIVKAGFAYGDAFGMGCQMCDLHRRVKSSS